MSTLYLQIKDDILDIVGDVEKLGKNINCDENINKTKLSQQNLN